jgi:hypothetical protein
MTDDDLEAELLKRLIAQHVEAERLDPDFSDKCLRELDLRALLSDLTGKAGNELEHEARIWLTRLAPRRPRPNSSSAVLRPCTNNARKDSEHKYHARAFLDASAGSAPAWDRLRELQRARSTLSSPSASPSMGTNIRVFVSHSAADVELAGRLIELLRAALNLPTGAIRCTSVDGYRLQIGADTNEQLRREVHDADAFIGIVSADSLRSLYVLFELGARWGADKQLMPILSPGTAPAVLGGPLAGLNALRADSRPQLHQLVSDLGAVLGLTPDSPAAYEQQISRL